MRRLRRKYDFEEVEFNKNILSAIDESFFTSQKTIEILLKNSTVFRPSNYHLVELTGFAKFGFVENPSYSFADLFKNMLDK